jgi:hypothetical protein
MHKEWLDTVLEVTTSTANPHVEDNEAFCGSAEASLTVSQTDVLPPQRLDGVIIGTLVGLNDAGEPLVDFPANCSGVPVVARSTVVVGEPEIGRETALMFEAGNPDKPIIMGLIQPPQAAQPTATEGTASDAQNPIVAEVDGERLVFRAKKEIILRCGKASITLTRAGKVLIRGAYLLSRSSGVNRIKGGSIQLN